jgi:eukaryotic-like serine/threonine-protein kinase
MSRVILQPGQWVRGQREQFAVLEWIGEGSYARVYRAEGPRGPAAIKLAKTEVDGAAGRLHCESELLALGLHPAIPTLYDTGALPHPETAPSEPFWIAIRWLPGETVRRRLQHGKSLPLVQTVPTLMRIADALAALHAAGWVHGDLRPDNVLLETATHQAFLLDLGEARRLERAHRQPTAVSRSLVLGRVRPLAPGPVAPVYADPATDGPGPTLATDLRQLGELLFWALTGTDPQREPDRLSRAAGYHPEVVQLWYDARRGNLPAAAFRDRLQRLSRQLGLSGK